MSARSEAGKTIDGELPISAKIKLEMPDMLDDAGAFTEGVSPQSDPPTDGHMAKVLDARGQIH